MGRLLGVARAVTTLSAGAATLSAAWTAAADGRWVLASVVLLALGLRIGTAGQSVREVASLLLLASTAAVVGVSGGPSDPTLGALLLLLAVLGFTWRPRDVFVAGVASVGIVVATAAWSLGTGIITWSWLWSLTLVAVAGVVSGRLPGGDREGTSVLTSVSRGLEEVVALAERMPAGFDRWAVAGAVRDELRDAAAGDHDLPEPMLLLAHDGVLFGVSSRFDRVPVGLVADLPRSSLLRTWHRLDSVRVSATLRRVLGEDRWLVHRLGTGTGGGAVLVPAELPSAALARVADVLRPATIALANVDLFERLGEVAHSAAQVRLAHDLHDGVAQALTHVRFELDLVGLEHPDAAEDLARVRRVADAALLEVRRTVDELRESVPFADRLARHVELVRSFAPCTIELRLGDELPLEGAAADEVFRLIQEALSNTVRHAGADTVRIEVLAEADGLTVSVVDDGCGVSASDRLGVGRTTMAARAQRLGGDLIVRPRRGGGTVVLLEVPLHSLHPSLRAEAAPGSDAAPGADGSDATERPRPPVTIDLSADAAGREGGQT